MKRSSGMRRRASIARDRLRADSLPQPSRVGDLRLALRQLEQVGRAVQPAFVVEFLDGLLAEPVDVEGGARDEMDQPFDALRGADQAAGAAPHRLARRTHGMAAADRTVVRDRHRAAHPPAGVPSPPTRSAGSRRRRAAAPRCRRCGCPCGRSRPRCADVAFVHQHAADVDRLAAARPGVSAPVRPTWMRMSCSTVVACSAGNFQAIAQRGARPTKPRRRCSARSSIL